MMSLPAKKPRFLKTSATKPRLSESAVAIFQSGIWLVSCQLELILDYKLESNALMVNEP